MPVQAYTPSNPNIPKDKYVRWRDSKRKKVLREETREALRNLWLGNQMFDSSAFQKKVDITGICKPKEYYRQISGGEWSAIENKNEPFTPAFNYTNTDNYRYWISSSYAKVKVFGNEAAADNDKIFIKIVFKSDPRQLASLRAHQQQGVQADPTKVALHREGFAELGNINNSEQVTDIVNRKLDHNLGFTRRHLDWLKQNLESFEKM